MNVLRCFCDYILVLRYVARITQSSFIGNYALSSGGAIQQSKYIFINEEGTRPFFYRTRHFYNYSLPVCVPANVMANYTSTTFVNNTASISGAGIIAGMSDAHYYCHSR